MHVEYLELEKEKIKLTDLIVKNDTTEIWGGIYKEKPVVCKFLNKKNGSSYREKNIYFRLNQIDWTIKCYGEGKYKINKFLVFDRGVPLEKIDNCEQFVRDIFTQLHLLHKLYVIGNIIKSNILIFNNKYCLIDFEGVGTPLDANGYTKVATKRQFQFMKNDKVNYREDVFMVLDLIKRKTREIETEKLFFTTIVEELEKLISYNIPAEDFYYQLFNVLEFL